MCKAGGFNARQWASSEPLLLENLAFDSSDLTVNPNELGNKDPWSGLAPVYG
jgi:hypothetical protein